MLFRKEFFIVPLSNRSTFVYLPVRIKEPRDYRTLDGVRLLFDLLTATAAVDFFVPVLLLAAGFAFSSAAFVFSFPPKLDNSDKKINPRQAHTDIVDHHSGRVNVSTAWPKFRPDSDVMRVSSTYDIQKAKIEMAAALRKGAKRSDPPVVFSTAPKVAIFVAGAINRKA